MDKCPCGQTDEEGRLIFINIKCDCPQFYSFIKCCDCGHVEFDD